MSASTPLRGGRPGPVRLALVAFLALLALVAAGCASSNSGSGGGSELLHYQRVWPDGTVEQETILSDGRIAMKHGETLERLTLSAGDLQRIKDALGKPIPTGSPDDSPKRTLTLPDGKVIEAPVPKPGTVTELLESLLQTHQLP